MTPKKFPEYPAKMLIEKTAAGLSSFRKAKAAYLFGSYAARRQLPFSDVDICVIGDGLSQREKNEISAMSSEKIDISFFDELPAYIKFRVMKEGKELFCKDRQFLDDAFFFALKEYFGLQRMLRRFEEKYAVV